ncbi:MAG: RNA polymerase subunit sigma-70 [Alphaproteobacteria bacterium]|nr:RNA polymerase subunit sigma-70 [Alphaproteobacteria bacterium]
MTVDESGCVADKVRRVGSLDISGGGQIVVQNGYAFVGHMKPPHGTTIIDVSDPAAPSVVAELPTDGPFSHTHKVRVAGDLMITNVEQNDRHLMRLGSRVAAVRQALSDAENPASDAAVAAELGLEESDVARLDEAVARGYGDGGWKVWDIADKSAPREIAYVRTHGFGVHRFDMDASYAYMSTEMEGYVGNILVIYDLADPADPQEVSRWWMPGQHIANGEQPDWQGYRNRLHHALRVGDEMWAAVWHAGFRVIDVSDITAPHTVAAHDYHPPYKEPTHTILPLLQTIDGRRIAVAIDEEHTRIPGQAPANLWVFDVSDFSDIKAMSSFHVSELDSPWAGSTGRFGAHQFHEQIDGTLIYCTWFSGGLRIVDVADPFSPAERGYFIPTPRSGFDAPQSNDVCVDERGLIYLLDRNAGLDILEFEGNSR